MSRNRSSYQRIDRVKEQILRELAQLIRAELKDPRAGMITLTEVELTRDYSYATVYYTVLNDDDRAVTQATLDRAKGYLRSALSRCIDLYRTPELNFVYDISLEHSMAIDRLLAQAANEKPVED